MIDSSQEHVMRQKNTWISLTAAVAAAVPAVSAHATDWLQFGYDQAHSGYNVEERGYPVASTTTAQWQVPVHALGSASAIPSDSTPVYVSNVNTASGVKDLLFLVTQNGTLVAFAANDGAVVWSKRPTPASNSNLTTGSPAVDPNLQYVYAYGLDGKVHKYQVGDGTEIVTGGWPQISTLKPDVEKGASALSFSTAPAGSNYLYVPTNGYVGDAGDYQGHVTTIDLTTGSQNIFNTQCSNLFMHFVKNGTARTNDCNLGTSTNPGGPAGRDGQMSGIWGRPGVVYDSLTNRIYLATGNGLFDANMAGGYEWGDSVLALKRDGTGSGLGMPVDSFTPSTFSNLYKVDADLGSTSPAILPSTSNTYPHLAVQSGKDACVRLLNLDDLSGSHGPGHAGNEINAATSCTTDAAGGQVRTQPAVWVNPVDGSTWFYLATDGNLFGYRLVYDGSGKPSLSRSWTFTNAAGTSPVVANGVVYYTSNNGSSNNTLRGVNALTGVQIWSATIGAIKWQSPIVVNGHLYVTDNGAQLWAFALDGVFKAAFE